MMLTIKSMQIMLQLFRNALLAIQEKCLLKHQVQQIMVDVTIILGLLLLHVLFTNMQNKQQLFPRTLLIAMLALMDQMDKKFAKPFSMEKRCISQQLL